jgi:cytochrome c oxidase cbb3-type subunit 3
MFKTMRFKAIWVASLACCLARGQADQVARHEQQKKPAAPALSLNGAPPIDPAAVERGKKIFEPACGFCHGLDARGKSGPDLLRSTLVLHDENGNQIGAMIRAGRPDRGMPPFPSMTSEQVADLAAFLHAGTNAVTNRFAYEIKGLLTGDPKQGEAFFNGEGNCTRCHSVTGDLAHVAGKYEPVELQRRLLYPAPNIMDLYFGKKVKPPAPSRVKVRLPSGEVHAGTLVHADEFTVTLQEGTVKSFSREPGTKVEIDNPLAAHEAMLPKYTDTEMHNMLAYLETLK